MFLWCFRRRRPSTSSIGDAFTIQTPLEPSQIEPKGGEQPKCMSRNPFIIDLVVEVMLEEADVDTLKILREMNSNWNKLDLKELEKRALRGQLGQLNFTWEGCPDHGHATFFHSTAAIPQLFHSFRLNFPNSFKSIHSFFPKYTPIFLHLQFHEKTQWTEDVKKYLLIFFSWISPTLQELEVGIIEDGSTHPQKQVILSSIPPMANGAPLLFQKLTKIIWDMGPDCDDSNNHIPFKFLFDKSGAVDPTPNLTTLEASINSDFLNLMNIGPNSIRWSKLTNLRAIESCGDEDARFPGTLLALAQSGMCLKELALALFIPPTEAYPWENWSQFLATQAKSLQILELRWNCSDKVNTDEFVMPKIRLPNFEVLHTLHFYMKGSVATPSGTIEPRIFELGEFRDHFSRVAHMRVNEQGLLNVFPVGGVPIPLKSIIINGVPNNWGVWSSRIRSVESLTCPASFFQVGGVQVPWKESLKELVIDDVSSPIKVSHLTSLRKLIVREWVLEIKIKEDRPYLANFKQILPLKLPDITFDSYEEPSDEDKARFNFYFSAPVNFQPIQVDQFPFYHYAI